MQSTTAGWAGCWWGLLMAAFTFCCFFPFFPYQACTTLKYQDPMVLHPSASSRLAMDLCCYLYLRRPGSSCWQPLISAVRNWQRRGKCTLQRQPGTFNLHQLEQWLLNTGNCFIHGVGLRQLLSNWPGALCPSSRVFCTHSRLDSPGQGVLSVQLLEHWQCPAPSLSASITAMRQPAPASEFTPAMPSRSRLAVSHVATHSAIHPTTGPAQNCFY